LRQALADLTSREAEPGIVMLMRAEGSLADRPLGPEPPSPPIFPVPRGAGARYAPMVEWLTRAGLIGERFDEEDG
jgi:hypothetical protein